MSSLQYFNDPGAGEKLGEMSHYSQAVIVGDIVKVSGQGGWNPETAEMLPAEDQKGQVELAIHNIDRVLQTVGLQGWEDVYAVRAFCVDLEISAPLFVEALKKRIPNHRPVLTGIGVASLAFPGMKVEIEVEAYAGNLKKKD